MVFRIGSTEEHRVHFPVVMPFGSDIKKSDEVRFLVSRVGN